MGATVVKVCRDHSKGEVARKAIIATGGSDGVELMLVDLSSQQSIRQLAAPITSVLTILYSSWSTTPP